MDSAGNLGRRSVLFLSGMPLEMVESQGRLWEAECRTRDGWCGTSCTIFWGSEKDRMLELEPGRNYCYGINPRGLSTGSKWVNRLSYVLRLFCLVFKVIGICRRHHIEVVVSFSNNLRELELVVMTASKLLGIPFVGYVAKNPTSLGDRKGFDYAIEKGLLKRADRVILRPGTEAVQGGHYGIELGKVIILQHQTRFHLLEHENTGSETVKWVEQDDGKTLFYYGRIEEDKRVLDILEAFALCRREVPGLRLLIAGPGPERDVFARRVAELGLQDVVRMESSKSQGELATLSARTDIHVHPTGGKALLESAVMGKPILVYDTKSHDHELIQHGVTGLRSRFGDVAELAQMMKRAACNGEESAAMAATLKTRALEESQSKAVGAKLARELEQLLAARKVS